MSKMDEFKDGDEVIEIRNPFVEYGRRKGIKIGIELGREEARAEAREIGREIGRKQAEEEIVLRMLNEGMSVELIAEFTKITKKQIEQIREKKINKDVSTESIKKS